MNESIYIPDPQPFWFVESELLTNVLRAEIRAVNHLTASEPGLRHLFDAPDATESQRRLCFTVLAHRKVLGMIYEKFAGLWEPSPNLGDEESKALHSTNGLVKDDAPNWVLETARVVEQLPSHMISALPEPLRTEGFPHHDPAKMAAVESASNAFGTIEQIQTFVQGVLDQQVERLAKRWIKPVITIEIPPPKKPRTRRARDEYRKKRYKLVAQIARYSQTQGEYLQSMDERGVLPHPTWANWPGTWRQAYKDKRLRKLIQQDKSRALALNPISK